MFTNKYAMIDIYNLNSRRQSVPFQGIKNLTKIIIIIIPRFTNKQTIMRQKCWTSDMGDTMTP